MQYSVVRISEERSVLSLRLPFVLEEFLFLLVFQVRAVQRAAVGPTHDLLHQTAVSQPVTSPTP
jgi:hypothetical protein